LFLAFLFDKARVSPESISKAEQSANAFHCQACGHNTITLWPEFPQEIKPVSINVQQKQIVVPTERKVRVPEGRTLIAKAKHSEKKEEQIALEPTDNVVPQNAPKPAQQPKQNISAVVKPPVTNQPPKTEATATYAPSVTQPQLTPVNISVQKAATSSPVTGAKGAWAKPLIPPKVVNTASIVNNNNSKPQPQLVPSEVKPVQTVATPIEPKPVVVPKAIQQPKPNNPQPVAKPQPVQPVKPATQRREQPPVQVAPKIVRTVAPDVKLSPLSNAWKALPSSIFEPPKGQKKSISQPIREPVTAPESPKVVTQPKEEQVAPQEAPVLLEQVTAPVIETAVVPSPQVAPKEKKVYPAPIGTPRQSASPVTKPKKLIPLDKELETVSQGTGLDFSFFSFVVDEIIVGKIYHYYIALTLFQISSRT
jgi:hypothetical protein